MQLILNISLNVPSYSQGLGHSFNLILLLLIFRFVGDGIFEAESPSVSQASLGLTM